MVVSSWLVLFVLDGSPYAVYFGHGELGSVNANSNLLELSLLFIVGWIIMMIAMMLPTDLTFFLRYHSLTISNKLRTLVLSIIGYLGVWTLFGVLTYLGDFTLHQIVSETIWIQNNIWIIPVTILIIAGLYELSPVKTNYLSRTTAKIAESEQLFCCRKNVWSFRTGFQEGLSCLGCCWALMLVTFGLGIGNISLMLLFSTVMIAQKNLATGSQIAKLSGIVLLTLGIIIALNSLIFNQILVL
jgi:predicted metal-binding membrane protein